MTTDDRSPLAGLQPPRAPHALAESVLAAAREALAEEAASTTWDRLWNSRPLRLAWAGSTFALLLAHVALSVSPGAAVAVAEEREQAGELREILDLPPMESAPPVPLAGADDREPSKEGVQS